MKLCVPFDFSGGTASLRYAFETYSDTDDVEIHAVHFTETPHETLENVVEKELYGILEETNGSADSRSRLRDQLQIEFVAVDDTGRASISGAIEQYAREHDIDQIIMSEEERSLLSKFFDKSNTKRLLESDVAPVTVVD